MNRHGTVYDFPMLMKVWHRFALLGQGKANLLKAISSNNGTGSTIPNRGDEAMVDTTQRAINVISETNLSAEEQVMVPRAESPGTQPVISPPMRLGFPDSFDTHQPDKDHICRPLVLRYQSLLCVMGLTDDILLIYLLWGFVWLASAIHAAVVRDIALGFEYRPSGIWWTPNLGACFLFRFLPITTLSVFGVIWPGADLFNRMMQPYAEMFGINVADKTILVDYLGAITPLVIISALSNRL